MTEVIRLGLPKGSLNTPDRGDTRQVFIDAGYDIRGYESGKESQAKLAIANDQEIKPFITRPQRSPMDLNRRILDIAITGDDWVEEDRVNGDQRYDIRKIGDLDYGQTTLVVAVAEANDYKSLSDLFADLRKRTEENPILCYTEYVNLTAGAISQNEAYREFFGETPPFVQSRGMTRPGNMRVQVLGSEGATEVSITMGADVIVDTSQSGQSLIDNRLRKIGEIMVSSAGLYAGPSCVGWKEGKAREIFEQLYGAVIGKKYFDVKFNIPLLEVGKVRKYLIEEGLCADEPTITSMEAFAAVNILIPRKRFPATLQGLRGLGASAIVRDEVKQFIP